MKFKKGDYAIVNQNYMGDFERSEAIEKKIGKIVKNKIYCILCGKNLDHIFLENMNL